MHVDILDKILKQKKDINSKQTNKKSNISLVMILLVL